MKFSFTILTVLAVISASFAQNKSKPFNQLKMRMKQTEIRIKFGSQQDAEKGELSIAPLPDGKKWAFTTRWDDNNQRHIRMRDLMTKHGYKCGFYLNSNYGREHHIKLARDLVKKGCGIGLHSMTHPHLTTLNFNEIFWEIIAVKVQRESDTDLPSVCYGFSFCNFRDKDNPNCHGQIAETMIRSGIHHAVNPSFLSEKLKIYPETFSVSKVMTPGDKNPNPKRFDQLVDSITKNKAYQQQDPIITLAFHTWHTEEGFANLEKCLIKHNKHDDWWYCEPNEYAAYRYRYHNSKLSLKSLKNKIATYELSTPVDGDAGRVIPLDLLVKTQPEEIIENGKIVPFKKTEKEYIFKVFSQADGTMPKKIDTIANPENSRFSKEAKARFGKFKDIVFHLFYDSNTNSAIFTAANQSNKPLSNIHIQLRLPPLFNSGIISLDQFDLPPKKEIEKRIVLGKKRTGKAYNDGSPYLVAQVNFNHNKECGRIYATCRGKQLKLPDSSPRDIAMVHGPFPNTYSMDFLKLSDPKTPLPMAENGDSMKGWCSVLPSTQKTLNSSFVLTNFRKPEQKAFLKKLSTEKVTGNVAVAFSFVPKNNKEQVLLNWLGGWGAAKANKIKHFFLNGKQYPAETRKFPVIPSHPNRLIVIVEDSAKTLANCGFRLKNISMTPGVSWFKN